MSIPTIDLTQAIDPKAREQLLASLRHALLDVGFLYVINHGIPQELERRLVSTLSTLFSLPSEAKTSAALVKSPHFLGYSTFGTETTAAKADQREQFEFANELPDIYNTVREQTAQDHPPLYLQLQGPCQYPTHASMSHLKDLIQQYIFALQDLASRFLDLAAEALELPPRTLHAFTGPQDRLKLVHYRPDPDGGDALSQGVGPHKDSSGWLTFLLQASPGTRGLQVLSKDGSWLDVPPVPGSLVVNMGQAFEVATNGVCKATTHRVLLPPDVKERFSVPFFQGVRPDLTKEELKGLWDHFESKKWQTRESEEGMLVDSPFLRSGFETWGEAQLRTKIRSHRDVAARWYPADLVERFTRD
jgi:isopenicillin N synthase-like dioxygenase